jgi:hypothetical protein
VEERGKSKKLFNILQVFPLYWRLKGEARRGSGKRGARLAPKPLKEIEYE